jgi:hypothetical protein
VHYGDVLSGVDFDYLAQVTRLNAISMASMAHAPMPPDHLAIKGAVAYNTTLSWQMSPNAASYYTWWRETTAPQWSNERDAGSATTIVLKNIILDDYFFGISAVSADGWESPVEFPGFAGSFARSPQLNTDGKPVDTLYPSPFPTRFSGKPVGLPSWRVASNKPAQ